MYDAQKKFISTVSAANLVKGSYWFAAYSVTANGFTVTPQAVVGNENVAYIRFTVLKSQMGEYPMIAVDEEIKYTVEGFLADNVKVKSKNIVGLNPGGSFDDSGFVKSVNGNTPDENGNVEIDLPDGGGHFVEGAGELVFSHTATFATDSEATLGVPVPGVSVVATLNAVYWLEVNGEMLKCHWEKDSSSSGMILNTRILYDEGRNEWVRSMSGMVMVYAQTAGTYTYSLYAPSNDPMLDPRYIPANVAKKSDIPTGGSASIDVTAQVGQTIIVKEVDASGKPTKWESADYQPRTHWSEEAVILPDTPLQFVDGQLEIPTQYAPITLNAGETYKIMWNGVEYSCICTETYMDGARCLIVGNFSAVFGTGDTGEPFAIIATEEVVAMAALDGSTSVTLSIKGVVCTPIPGKYLANAFPYYIEVTTTTADDGTKTMTIKETAAELRPLCNSGRTMIVRKSLRDDANGHFATLFIPLYSKYVWDDGKVQLYFHSKYGTTASNVVIICISADGTVVVTDNF
jgi:hypothetical protein